MCLNCDLTHPNSVHNPLPSLEGPEINIQQWQQPIKQEESALSEKRGTNDFRYQMHAVLQFNIVQINLFEMHASEMTTTKSTIESF